MKNSQRAIGKNEILSKNEMILVRQIKGNIPGIINSRLRISEERCWQKQEKQVRQKKILKIAISLIKFVDKWMFSHSACAGSNVKNTHFIFQVFAKIPER